MAFLFNAFIATVFLSRKLGRILLKNCMNQGMALIKCLADKDTGPSGSSKSLGICHNNEDSASGNTCSVAKCPALPLEQPKPIPSLSINVTW